MASGSGTGSIRWHGPPPPPPRPPTDAAAGFASDGGQERTGRSDESVVHSQVNDSQARELSVGRLLVFPVGVAYRLASSATSFQYRIGSHLSFSFFLLSC